MIWGGASEFFAMGGHGFFVWGSFVAVAAAMAMEPLLLRARRRRALEHLKQERRRNEATK